ncbi:PREDICTED: uncharacterized protein LOC104819305 [Tarenaya hassleriana]|uniref:uncharacterized protein LOC104819305 n=1 Tax=Tarenaya hassleriana TaxID=28532 RepID=UPI00053C56F1|nr:PREDICTED: uncharacterized protein LOC104819305 [Tarenaya hassleriana]XP_019058688.1 PREDICTED: uncharacterized protein LOC104819305 [Tarenaya hassleriana]
MTGGSCSVGSKEARPTLGDMTNLPSKRGISSILGDFLLKSGDESGNTAVREKSGVKFSKRLCLVVEDLVKESSRGSDSNTGSSPFEDNTCSGCSPVENTARVVGKEPEESNHAEDALDVDAQSLKAGDGNAAVEIANEDGEKDRYMSSSNSVQPCLEHSEKDTSDMPSTENECNVTGEGIAKPVFSTGSEGCDILTTGGDEATRGRELPDSQGFRSFEMSRCSSIDRMGHVDHNMGADLLKSCSCSFCLKAAYIWSDLHYQDIKGRLSVLKKSQKEAASLIQRNSRGKQTGFHGSANSTSSIKLESDLVSQWRSLFLNMGDILSRESNHLQMSFVAMIELRDNCKMDLERASKTPQQ